MYKIIIMSLLALSISACSTSPYSMNKGMDKMEGMDCSEHMKSMDEMECMDCSEHMKSMDEMECMDCSEHMKSMDEMEHLGE